MSFHFCIVCLSPCTEPGLRLAPNEQYLLIFIHSNPGLEHLRSSAPEPFSGLFLSLHSSATALFLDFCQFYADLSSRPINNKPQKSVQISHFACTLGVLLVPQLCAAFFLPLNLPRLLLGVEQIRRWSCFWFGLCCLFFYYLLLLHGPQFLISVFSTMRLELDDQL